MAKASRKSYTAARKLQVVDYAERNGNRLAARLFNVSEKSVRDWRRDKAQLEAMDKLKRANRGRKCLWPRVEGVVSEWIDKQGQCLIPVSRIMIRMKAIEVAREFGEANFSGCTSWCDRFMKRKGLSRRRRTRISQKMPRDYEEKMMKFQRFIIKMRQENSYELGQIGNMDEVPMCFDMPPDCTVDRRGGHEDSHFTVVLSCCADGTKLQPLVVFKRKTVPKEHVPAGVFVRVYEKGWMEEKGVIDWIKTVWAGRPGAFLKKRAMLVMDAFRGHVHDSVREQLKAFQTDVAIVPGGMTGILQPLDVVVSKPFKDRVKRKWVDWLSGNHPDGTVKGPSLATVCGWIKDSWDDIPTELIVRAFLKTSISNRLDGTEDDALFNSGTGTGTDTESEDSEHYSDLGAVFAHSDSSDEELLGVDAGSMTDSNLIMECEEEELEPWQQVDDNIQEEDMAVVERKAGAASPTALAAVPCSAAAVTPVDNASAAPPPGPSAALPALVSATAEVSAGSPVREGEQATVVPSDSPAPGPSTAPSPPVEPLFTAEAVQALAPPATPRLILTHSPAPLGTVPLSQVPQKLPGNISGQPVLIATQDTPQSQKALGGALPPDLLDQVQKAVAGQNMLSPVGFLLNGQAFTFLTASASQLFKPAITQALSQPTNQQPVSTEENQQPVAMAVNQQPATIVANQQLATTVANQLPATMVTNQQPGTTAANQQPGTTVANQQPFKSFTVRIPGNLTIQSSGPFTKITAKPASISKTTAKPASITTAKPASITMMTAKPASITTAKPASITKTIAEAAIKAIPQFSRFTLQKVAEKRPFNPEVKRLIQAVNEASISATQAKTLQLVKPTSKAPANRQTTAAPPSKVKVLPPKPALGSKMCPQCGAQYRVVEALRGLLCLCSPEITRGLQAIGAAGASNVRPALSPAASKAPASRTAAPKPAAPRVAATACVALSPASRPPSSPDDEGESGYQGKLIMLVDDFYYGRDEGKGVLDTWDASQQGPAQFRCLRCDKKLKSNIRLMNHLRHHIELEQQSGEVDTHTSCQHCYRQFPTPFRLQCHLETVHSQYESTTKCKICEWAFESEPVFLQHMKNTHSAGEMPYICQVCEFRSSMYSDVLSHFRTWHKDTIHLLCPYCLKVFKTNGNYQHHYSRHQRKSVYHCDKCRLQFLCTRDKMEHKLSQHKSFRKPWQLEGLRPGTKVTIRAYAVENKTVGITMTSLPRTMAVKPEPAAQAVSAPVRKLPVAKRKPMFSMQELLAKFQENRVALGKQSCLECTFDIPDFPNHFPSYVSCSLCHYSTCCSRAYANHMINNHVSRKTSTKYLALYKAGPRWSELVCTTCSFTTQVGDQMAKHLVKNPDHSSSYCTLKGPPVRGQRSQRRGDAAARTLNGPDGGPAVQDPPVSSRVLPFPVLVSSTLDNGDGDGGGREQDARREGGTGAHAAGRAGRLSGAAAVRQLRVLLFALCCGVPRAARRFHAPPQLIWTWLLERERGLERAGAGGAGEQEERLAEWVLARREQQLPVHEKNLLARASALFRQPRAGPQHVSHQQMVDFLLRWRLGVQATGAAGRPLPSRAEKRARLFLESFSRSVAGLAPSAVGALDEFSVFVNFDLLAGPASSRERRQFAFHLAGSGAALCDVFLSALADGTLLPALVFAARPRPNHLRLPRTVRLEARPEGFSPAQQLQVWASRVWREEGGAGAQSVLVMDGFRGHQRLDFQEALREAGTLSAVLPQGCSGRLQPLETCVGPAFRAFLEARWSRLVEEGGAEGGAEGGPTPSEMLQLVVDWLGEALEGLSGLPELLRHSFHCCGLTPARAGGDGDEGDPAKTQTELLRTLTEVLMGPQLADLMPPEQEEAGTEAEEAGEGRSCPNTSIESSAANPQALRSIFEKDSDVESFLGFDESEISAAFGQ